MLNRTGLTIVVVVLISVLIIWAVPRGLVRDTLDVELNEYDHYLRNLDHRIDEVVRTNGTMPAVLTEITSSRELASLPRIVSNLDQPNVSGWKLNYFRKNNTPRSDDIIIAAKCMSGRKHIADVVLYGDGHTTQFRFLKNKMYGKGN